MNFSRYSRIYYNFSGRNRFSRRPCRKCIQRTFISGSIKNSRTTCYKILPKHRQPLLRFYDSLCSSVYEKEEILLISPKGKVLMDTSQKFIAEDFPELKSFDPGKSSGSYYQIGDFFGYFQEEQLSVMVPVTVNMQVKGYVSMHLPMSVLCHQRDSLLDTIHILFLLFLGIMMLIIPIFYIMINRPLEKNHTRSKHVCIWKSQIQYSFR